MEDEYNISPNITIVVEESAQWTGYRRYKARSANDAQSKGWVENTVGVAPWIHTGQGERAMWCSEKRETGKLSSLIRSLYSNRRV